MTDDNTKGAVHLNNASYDLLSKLAQYWLPAAGALYFALAAIWGLPYAEQIIGTITALDIFLGVVLGISKQAYKNSPAAYDGVLVVGPDDQGGSTIQKLEVEVPLEGLSDKGEVTLRFKDASQ